MGRHILLSFVRASSARASNSPESVLQINGLNMGDRE